jgi:hypothetical protein
MAATRQSDEARCKPVTIPQADQDDPEIAATAHDVDAAIEASVDATPIHRELAIAEIAYLLAERRGLAPGYELDDWLAAENESDRLLSSTANTARRLPE